MEMHFEEVNCAEATPAEPEIQYMAEDEEAVLMHTEKESPVEESSPEIAQPVKRKVPIIRKAGEIVTPTRSDSMANFKAISPTPASSQSSTTTPTARIKPEWTKVEAPSTTLSLTKTALADRVLLRAKPMKRTTLIDHDNVKRVFVTQSSSQNTDQTQMDRIERKMDEILTRLERHETEFRQMKNSITDLKMELKSSVLELKEHYVKPSESIIPKVAVRPLPPAKRKRLVVLPVADDNYLLRLEELVNTDDEIQEDLTALFRSAPTNSVYEFLRYNLASLFKNCSKYTWTGKPSNSFRHSAPCNSACNLALVSHLMNCAAEVFPSSNRESITKEFRRALDNFNDAMKRKRQAEKLKASSGDAEESNGAGDDEENRTE